jgi:DtxR family Mn-dependent transcriptional regulator
VRDSPTRSPSGWSTPELARETFLARALGMGWDEVHAEAELLEHVLSDRLEERIDAALGHPTHDPHGDPIPPRHGQHTEAVGQPLDTAPPGCRFRVERVSDRDSAALRYLSALGIAPGVVVDVEEQEPFGGPRWVRIDGARHALGAPLSGILRGHVVTEAEPPHGGGRPTQSRTAPTDTRGRRR